MNKALHVRIKTPPVEKVCWKCLSFGHLQKECKSESKCGRCGIVGHKSDACPTAAVAPCLFCKSVAHLSYKCPQTKWTLKEVKSNGRPAEKTPAPKPAAKPRAPGPMSASPSYAAAAERSVPSRLEAMLDKIADSLSSLSLSVSSLSARIDTLEKSFASVEQTISGHVTSQMQPLYAAQEAQAERTSAHLSLLAQALMLLVDKNTQLELTERLSPILKAPSVSSRSLTHKLAVDRSASQGSSPDAKRPRTSEGKTEPPSTRRSGIPLSTARPTSSIPLKQSAPFVLASPLPSASLSAVSVAPLGPSASVRSATSLMDVSSDQPAQPTPPTPPTPSSARQLIYGHNGSV
jgi:uncharacterized coiled-coil protein SlyX